MNKKIFILLLILFFSVSAFSAEEAKKTVSRAEVVDMI
jgi:uncharacterized protein YgiM (DUF1202 family)